jgi:uncharacterized protein (TIGR02145 family)
MLHKSIFLSVIIFLHNVNVHAQQFNPDLTYGEVKDIEGNNYKTIQIGNQVWMAENLRTTKYRNNTPITNHTDNTQWQNNTTGAWSYYNNDATNNTPYGKLYNWYAVVNSNGICPTGWHVPTDAEWTTLTNFLGGESVAGGMMKSTGTQYWLSSNTNATNSSGWSGLPGCFRGNSGTFYTIGYNGYWWSSTEFNTNDAWNRVLYNIYGGVSRYDGSKTYGKALGFSVRCLRD